MANVDLAPAQPVPVPVMDAEALVAWLYSDGVQVRFEGEGHTLTALPQPPILISLLELARSKGSGWVLLDGPRQVRAYWVLDPWWSDQPESSPALLAKVPTGCVQLEALTDALRRRFPAVPPTGPQL